MAHSVIARRRALVFVFLALSGTPRTVCAQGGFLWQGIVDVEAWKTDSASNLLARGSGHPSLLGRIDTWAAAEPLRNIVFFAEVLGETGPARIEAGSEIYFKRGGVRFSPSDAFTLEGGKIPQVVGTFSSRQLSTRNPLIGTPDGYAATYSYGARVDGSVGVLDYRGGVESLSLWREGYTPQPGKSLHPAVGLGVTPIASVRLGASAMRGPYLSDAFSDQQLKGQSWRTYRQTIIAGDARVSIDYLEVHAEVARSTYDVPGQSATSNGLQYYVESKYTVMPRLYVAARYERNDYPFIGAFGPNWVANNSIVSDGEVGGGFRPAASTLVKLTVRKDHRAPNARPSAPHDAGYAVALQLSQAFDALELITRGP